MAMLNARPATGKLICEGCGCTDAAACPGGCHWVSHDPAVCSACADGSELAAEVYAGPGLDGAPFGAERCPASPTPAPHIPIFLSESEGYCARCRCGFAT